MRDTLGVQVVHASKNLLKAALDLGGRHTAAFDRGVEVPTGTELHYFTPVQVFILDEVDRLNDIGMV